MFDHSPNPPAFRRVLNVATVLKVRLIQASVPPSIRESPDLRRTFCLQSDGKTGDNSGNGGSVLMKASCLGRPRIAQQVALTE
jgi:hypothetical protein